MHKHDIVTGLASLAIAAVVVATGVIPLGAPMQGDLLALLPFPGSELARGRYHKDVQVQPLDDFSRFPTVKEDASSSSDDLVIAEQMTACDAAKEIVVDLDGVLKKTLPVRPDFAKARAALKKVQRDALGLYCGHASPSIEEDAVTVDNDCEQFSENALRHTQCTIMEKMGKTYRGY